MLVADASQVSTAVFNMVVSVPPPTPVEVAGIATSVVAEAVPTPGSSKVSRPVCARKALMAAASVEMLLFTAVKLVVAETTCARARVIGSASASPIRRRRYLVFMSWMFFVFNLGVLVLLD